MIEQLDRKTANEKYGPWAVIAGGSDGTGEAFARHLAALGLNIFLVSRRGDVLNSLANELQQQHGVEARVLVQDLMAPDAAANMLQSSADLDVGLYVSNAGVDGTASYFFDEPIERWKRLATMNVSTVTEAVHGFGNRFRARGRGGILLMASMMSLGGAPYLAMYSATKAFEMVLVEAVWAELKDQNVDVAAVLGPLMNTAMHQRELVGKGVGLDETYMYECDEIASECLARLGKQPLIFFKMFDTMDPRAFEKGRLDNVLGTLNAAKTYFPPHRGGPSAEKIDQLISSQSS